MLIAACECECRNANIPGQKNRALNLPSRALCLQLTMQTEKGVKNERVLRLSASRGGRFAAFDDSD